MKKAFSRLTGQPVGVRCKKRYRGYNIWQMQRALDKFVKEGKMERWGNGVYKLKGD